MLRNLHFPETFLVARQNSHNIDSNNRAIILNLATILILTSSTSLSNNDNNNNNKIIKIKRS